MERYKTLWYSVIRWCRMFMGFMFYETFCRWRMKFLSGTQSNKDAAKSGRPLTNKANVSKVRQATIQSDDQYTIYDMQQKLVRVHFILRHERFLPGGYLSWWYMAKTDTSTNRSAIAFFFQNSIKYNLKTLWLISINKKNLKAQFPKA